MERSTLSPAPTGLASSPSRRGQWRLRLLLLAIGGGVGLLATELVLRLSGRFEPPRYPIVCKNPQLYQHWKPYGYRLWPSRTMHDEYPKNNPRRLTIIANQHGFRSRRELHETDERTRVLVSGDSFVFGLGLEHEERFSNVMESLQPQWRVDNLGMTGYGPDLMLMALEEVGLVPRPDVVLVCIYTDDFHRVRTRYAGVGFEIPRFQLLDGQLQIVPFPRRTFRDSMRVVQLLRKVKWNYTNAEWQLNAAILRRFTELSRQYDFSLGLVFLPGSRDMDNDRKRRRWLKEFADRHDTAFIDLTEEVHEVGDDAFIPENSHYNPRGHRIVAERLVQFTMQLIDDPP